MWPWALNSLVPRSGMLILVQTAITIQIGSSHRHPAADRITSFFAYEICLQFLIAQVGSFLEIQSITQEEKVIDSKDDLPETLVFILDVEAIFSVTGFWDDSQVPNPLHLHLLSVIEFRFANQSIYLFELNVAPCLGSGFTISH
jgi:hypothetical protein